METEKADVSSLYSVVWLRRPVSPAFGWLVCVLRIETVHLKVECVEWYTLAVGTLLFGSVRGVNKLPADVTAIVGDRAFDRRC